MSKCMNCGRFIKSGKSIKRGMGPVCWRRVQDDGITGDLFADQDKPVFMITNHKDFEVSSAVSREEITCGPTHPYYEMSKEFCTNRAKIFKRMFTKMAKVVLKVYRDLA